MAASPLTSRQAGMIAPLGTQSPAALAGLRRERQRLTCRRFAILDLFRGAGRKSRTPDAEQQAELDAIDARLAAIEATVGPIDAAYRATFADAEQEPEPVAVLTGGVAIQLPILPADAA